MNVDKIQNWLVQNFEKILFTCIVALAAFLVYSGTKKEDFTQKYQPDQLTQEANQVKRSIEEEDRSEVIIEERLESLDFDIVGQTKKLYTPVDPSGYKLENSWQSKGLQSIVKRTDPVLAPIEDLRVQGVVATLALRGGADIDDYPVAKLKGADPVDRVEPRSRGGGRRGGRGGPMGPGGPGGMPGGAPPGFGGMMGAGGPDIGDMLGMGGGGRRGNRGGDDDDEEDLRASRQLDKRYDFYDFRPIATEDERQPKPGVGLFIAGTALLPHKAIYEAYELALKDATGYDPARRDTPVYIDFEVTRADVTEKAVEELTDDDWVKVWDREFHTNFAGKSLVGTWSGFAPEIVPADYRDEFLTLWIPPVLLKDYQDFAVHPKIPMKSRAEIKREKMAGEDVIELGDETFTGDGDTSGLTDPGESGGMPGFPGGMPGGFPTGPGGPDMGDFAGMMGGMMGMGSALGGGRIDEDPVDHKLVRYYDFAGLGRNPPQPGREYVYRIRYAVNDPNFPAVAAFQPKPNRLTTEVAERVYSLMARAEENDERDFRRWSEWSEPSAPVTLPPPGEQYVGKVEGAATQTWNLAGRPIEYSNKTAKAEIVTSQFDAELGVEVPIETTVIEGSVVSAKADEADVVDPITLDIRTKPDAKVVTTTTVVDIDGGGELSIADGVERPGYVLFYDAAGRLVLDDTVSDLESYRIKTYAEEKGK